MNGVLLLAAGLSRRYGEDKRLARMANGKGLIQSTLEAIDQSELPCLVVLRHDDYDLRDQLQADFSRLHFVRCPESALGMGYSLAFGVEQAAFRRFTCLAISLADMPLIEPATYRRVCMSLKSDNIVIPRHQERIGHPIGFGSDFFSELKSIRADRGAREVWQNHPESVEYLDLSDAGILADVDEPEDMAKLEDHT